jgi:hypothetical protein
MPHRMTRLKQAPFLRALTDQQRLEPAIPKLEGSYAAIHPQGDRIAKA